MSKELIEFAKNALFYQGDIGELGKMLPDSDEKLIELMNQMIDQLEAEAFTNLWMSAHWENRKIPGQLFAKGAALMDSPLIISSTAYLCAKLETEDHANPGETALALIEAVENGNMGSARELVALCCAVKCWEIAHGSEKPVPDKIGLIGRTKAREYFSFGFSLDEKFAQQQMLNNLAALLDDDHMRDSLREKGIFAEPTAQSIEQTVELKLSKILPERKPNRVISGHQVRRAVPKLSRNAPCHCGSGKKYKKCCFAEDKVKLSRSSEIEGVTIDELDKQKEERITPDDVGQMRAHELLKLDPARINEPALLFVGRRLLLFEEFDQVLKIYHATPYKDSPAWDVVFSDMLFYSSEKKRIDLIDQVLSIKPELEEDHKEQIQFTRAESNPAEILILIETKCKEILELEEQEKNNTEPPEMDRFGRPMRARSTLDWTELAFQILQSDYPYLGISFARSVLPVAQQDTETLVEAVEKTRDSLGLIPVDLCDEIMQICDGFDSKQWLEEMEHRIDEKHSKKFLNQAKKIEAKEKQYRSLQSSLLESQKETARIEKRASEKLKALEKQTTKNNTPEKSNDNPEIKEMREQIKKLKEDVKLKHSQRNELRRELRDSRIELENQTRDDQAEIIPTDESDEEALLEQKPYSANAISRIPIFPENFIEAKNALPDHVVSTAIKLVGRLASGDDSAFIGTKRLKAKREFLRQKVSRSYRLIFTINDNTLEVVDLINRRDLEKWLA